MFSLPELGLNTHISFASFLVASVIENSQTGLFNERKQAGNCRVRDLY